MLSTIMKKDESVVASILTWSNLAKATKELKFISKSIKTKCDLICNKVV